MPTVSVVWYGALVLFIVFDLTACTYKPAFKVGSWNLQRLGLNKLADAESMDIIIKTISRFDIVALLEIVDSSGEAMKQLVKKVNEANKDDPYQLTISERLGRTVYKEQYGFLYKPSVVSVEDTYQYIEPNEDVFQFEPYIVTFQGKFYGMKKFAMAPIHTKPDDAEKEISELANVYDTFRKDTGLEDLMILGDFNAGCGYVTSSEWDKIKLWTDKRFQWLLTSHEDTTTKWTTCPYDRIVLAGDKLKKAVKQGSAKAFYYDDYYGTDYKQTTAISDHYPVEVLIKYDPADDEDAYTITRKLEISEKYGSTGVDTMVAAAEKSDTDGNNRYLQLTDDYVVAVWASKDADDTGDSIKQFIEDYPDTISSRNQEIATYKLQRISLEDHHDVSVTCERQSGVCSVLITWNGSFF